MGQSVHTPDNGLFMSKILGLDESLLTIYNNLKTGVQICSQTTNCYDCDYVCHVSLSPGANASLVFPTNFPNEIIVHPGNDVMIGMTLPRNTGNTTFICEVTKEFRDQSSWSLTLNESSCLFQLVKEGRQDMTPLWFLIAFYVLLAGVLYVATTAWKTYKKSSSYSSLPGLVGRNQMVIPPGPISNDLNASGDGKSFRGSRNHGGGPARVGIIRGLSYTSGSNTRRRPTQMSSSASYSSYFNDIAETPVPSLPSPSSIPEDDRLSEAGSDTSSEERKKSTVVSADVAEQELNKVGKKKRVMSLDAFRGLIIILMIFVNVGGGGYYFFAHARWFGMTVADIVFPSFILMMGMSTALSIRNRLMERKDFLIVGWKILRRSIKLFVIGLILNTDYTNLTNIRIPGVLQRFSISYFVVASLHLVSIYRGNKYLARTEDPTVLQMTLIFLPEALVHLTLLVIYLFFTLFFEYSPDCMPGYQGPGGLHDHSRHFNCTGGAANAIDRVFFGENHLYPHCTSKSIYGHILPHDPEGLLGVTTSILLTEIGLICGRIIIKERSHYARLIRWFIMACVFGILSFALASSGLIPVVKNLWSLSFILASAFITILSFLVMYLLVDTTHAWKNGLPFHYAGTNAILLYIGHEVFNRYFPFYYEVDDTHHSWLLIRAATTTTLWLLISVYCYHKELFWTL